MRLTYSFGSYGAKRFSTEATQVIVGRKGADLDLSPDQAVSRKHASITFENGGYYVEDAGSRNGTLVNNTKISEKLLLRKGDVVKIGETTLIVEIEDLAKREEEKQKIEQERKRVEEERRRAAEAARPVAPEPPRAEPVRAEPPKEEKPLAVEGAEELRGEVKVTSCFNIKDLSFAMEPTPQAAKDVIIATAADVAVTSERKLAIYYEIAMALGEEGDFEVRLQKVVDRALEAIPLAKRATLLMKERKTDRLLLTAHAPKGTTPAISQTLTSRAMTQREALNWVGEGGEARAGNVRSDSLVLHNLRAGMYVPLVWKNETIGVFCMDSGDKLASFDDRDLRLLTAISNHIAMCAANHTLQDQLQTEAAMKSNLLRQFSPRVAEKLMAGRIGGGDRTEATILCSDVRGFTLLTQNMNPKDVVDMLNDYFSELTPAIFEYDGTVDKFIGDAILAVFGSPEHDENQCEKAVLAALEMQKRVKEINEHRERRRQTTFQIGIGIHNGQVLHGFIGSADRMEFTVIGDTVNRAARLCDGAERGEVVASKNVYQRVYSLVDAQAKNIKTKHADEGELEAYLITGLKKK